MYRIDEQGLHICPFCDKHYKPELEKPPCDDRKIQEIFPNATPAQREQYVTGVCSQECWNENLGIGEQPEGSYQVIRLNNDGTTTVLKEAYSLSDLAHSDIDPGFFPITFVSKDDVKAALRRDKGDYSEDPDPVIDPKVDALCDTDMRGLAEDMADDYVNQMYWMQIPILVERYFENQQQEAQPDGTEAPV